MIDFTARSAVASIAATLGLVLAVQAQAQDGTSSFDYGVPTSGFDALVLDSSDTLASSGYGDTYLDSQLPGAQLPGALQDATALSLFGFGKKAPAPAQPINVAPGETMTANGALPFAAGSGDMTLAAANDPIVRGPDGRLYRLPLNAPVQHNGGAYAPQPSAPAFAPVPGGASSYNDGRIPASIGAHIGTLGAGVNATFFFSDAYSVTGIYEYGKLGIDRDTAKIDNLNFDADGDSGSVYMNFHPMRSNLHLSAGLQKGAPGVYASGSKVTPSGTIDFQGSLNSSWNYGPYLGVGVGSRMRSTSGFSFYGDLGLSYMGQADTTFTQSAACSTLAAADQSACLSSAKAFRDLVDGFDGEYLYPVLRFGASYRF
jgi:hypothetical protein